MKNTYSLLRSTLILVILNALITLFMYPTLPDNIIIYIEEFYRLTTLLSKASLLLTTLIPCLISLGAITFYHIKLKGSSRFQTLKSYCIISYVLVLFSLLVHLNLLLLSLGFPIYIEKLLPIGISVLFILIGYLLSVAPYRSYFGIRTKWALANTASWSATHQMASFIFTIIGILFFLFAYLPISYLASNLMLLLILLLSAPILSIIYSYWYAVKH